MAQQGEIVITGLGVVSPIGVGVDAFWRSLCEATSGVAAITAFDCAELPVNFGGQVRDFDPKQFVRPRKSLKVMSRDIQLGFVAADLALADAGLAGEGLAAGGVEPERLGVVFGADMIYCELDELVDAYRSCLVEGGFDFNLWGQRALGQMQPLWLLKYLPNMTASHIGIAHDARGPSNALVLQEVSSLSAIAEAARIIERGQADVMIAGGASARNHPSVWTFRDDRLMSHRREDPAGACRPFDADRDGMVTGEGAAAVVLERRSHAAARGARIRVAVGGYASTFAPPAAAGTGSAVTSGAATLASGRPKRTVKPPYLAARRDALDAAPELAIRRAIEIALKQAGVSAADVDHVNAHGLSTPEHDRIEAQAIRGALGDVPVTAPKSFFGNLGAATGAVELAATLLAFEHGQVPVTLNYRRPDPDCPVNVVHGQPALVNKPAAVLLNQALAGQAAAMVVLREA